MKNWSTRFWGTLVYILCLKKTQTPVTFSNIFKKYFDKISIIIGVQSLQRVSSVQVCSLWDLIKWYWLRLFQSQQFTTDKLTTVVEERGQGKDDSVLIKNMYKFIYNKAKKLMKEFFIKQWNETTLNYFWNIVFLLKSARAAMKGWEQFVTLQ